MDAVAGTAVASSATRYWACTSAVASREEHIGSSTHQSTRDQIEWVPRVRAVVLRVSNWTIRRTVIHAPTVIDDERPWQSQDQSEQFRVDSNCIGKKAHPQAPGRF